MPVDLSQLSEREAKALSHTVADQLGPEHTPAAILSTLRLEGHEHELMEHLQPYATHQTRVRVRLGSTCSRTPHTITLALPLD